MTENMKKAPLNETLLTAAECSETALALFAVYKALTALNKETLYDLIYSAFSRSALSFAGLVKEYGSLLAAGLQAAVIVFAALITVHCIGWLFSGKSRETGSAFLRRCHAFFSAAAAFALAAALCAAAFWIHWKVIEIIRIGISSMTGEDFFRLAVPMLALAAIIYFLWISVFYHYDMVSVMKNFPEGTAGGQQGNCIRPEKTRRQCLQLAATAGTGFLLAVIRLNIPAMILCALLCVKYLLVRSCFPDDARA